MSQEGVKAGGNQEAEGSKLRVSGHPSTAQTRRRDAVMEAGLSRGLSLNCGLLNIRRWAPVSRVRVRVWFVSHLTVTSPVHASCRNASARQPRQPRCGMWRCVLCARPTWQQYRASIGDELHWAGSIRVNQKPRPR